MARFFLFFIICSFVGTSVSFGANFMLVTDKMILAPQGMMVLCQEKPTSIVCARKRPATISLAAHADEILAVNTRVNTTLQARSDPRGKDVWHLDAREGDCEEFVLAKLVALVEIGIPRGALSIASAKVAGTYHAILVVSTDEGDFVLDNLNPNVTLWVRLQGYQFSSRESADDPLLWTLVL